MAKPTRSDLLTLGLPAPAVVQPPQHVEQVTAATGTLYMRGHGLSLGDALELRVLTSTTIGATPGALPTGLSEGVTYYARPVTAGAFQLATTPTGSAISSFGSAGVGRFAILLDSGAALDQACDDAWATVLSDLTAHGGDVEAPIVSIAAKFLAARLYVAHMAAGDAAKAASYDGIAALYAEVYAPKLAAYFRGIPVRGATDATPTVSEGSPRFRVLGPAAPSFGTSSPEVV